MLMVPVPITFHVLVEGFVPTGRLHPSKRSDRVDLRESFPAVGEVNGLITVNDGL